ncbi:hypothetical protein ACFY1U_33320 [Streptomyces sp. NPDC001351]|uniref:hypothetical protein n=1 Tax=Streptomyces sp. NPDC001351 TaxID=3364564 RepID=UPI0036C49F4A
MSDAVYGLIGALGGSLLTAAVAYWGPLHQQREVAKQAELQRSADMRRAEMEIEAVRAQAEEARRGEAIQAEIGRLVDVRSALRVWQFELDRAHDELRWAGPLDLDRFREDERELMTKGVRALDEVMHDQWFVPVSLYELAPEDPPTRRIDRSSSPNGLVVEALKDYGARIRALALVGRPASDEEKAELDQLKARANQERGMMSELIEERLENIVEDLPRNQVPPRSQQARPRL